MSRVRRAALVRRAVDVIGRFALGAGVLLLAFAAYLRWGTAWQEARAQDRLRREFAVVVADVPTSTTAPAVRAPRAVARVTTSTSTTTTTPPPPAPALGEPVALLRIPRLGLDKVVVEGAGTDQLRLGPGHYATTPAPGQPGNVAIAGHRTTYGAPFRRLDEVRPGDEILLTTPGLELRYVVTGSAVVPPDAVGVLAPAGDDRLTLTTCDPPYSARARLVVTAVVDGDPWPAPVVERPVTAAPLRLAMRGDQTAAPSTVAAPAPKPPSTGDGGSPLSWPVIWSAAVTALIVAAVWFAVRRTGRRWLALPGGAPVVVSLVVFFERLAAALPPEV